MPPIQCALCGFDAEAIHNFDRDTTFARCATCGEYEVSDEFLAGMRDMGVDDRALLPYLSAHTRQSAEQGIRVLVTTSNWRDLALSHRRTPVSQKLYRLLSYLGSCTLHAGEPVPLIFAESAPLFDAASDREVDYLVNALVQTGYLRQFDNIVGGQTLLITPEGWARLEPPAEGGVPGRCFVAMSFDSSLNVAYTDGIQRAVTECRFEPIRIDLVHHNEKICDRILAEIRLAQFMVADFTLHRAGVYFEAGFAMGLGRPVIWTCRRSDLGQAHFDTRQYNHIEWDTPEELRTKLGDRIRATMSR